MKILTMLSLLFTMGAFAQQDQPLNDVKFKPNDGTDRPGNPGTFKPDSSSSIKKKSYQSTSTQPELQKEEASEGKSNRQLDMSTNPDSKRRLPNGKQIQLDDEEEE